MANWTTLKWKNTHSKHVEIPADVQEQFHKDDELENAQTE